ncbi:SUMO-activating enzyme subunit 2 isoform X2 [Centruroides vittatus]|uniref:SUMO-activating enzyme subunit 2 isoform X2 n=1 Tax=Centruroides vittatus TaxID=120091 RepID=UPI00350F90B1
MAASISGILDEEERKAVLNSRILVVGAGGIGCELLKNLVLTGFSNIDVIDLDTIDVSNLNRQFLFRKEHVGKSKAMVAKESVQKFNPEAKIEAHHDSVTNVDYGIEFFKQFSAVLNALDNRAARSHVNRLCLASNVPIVESGTAGYLGQVTVIKKNITECYECQPKPTQKTYPGCTIRNTPSEPIHCIIWAKHLFNQLFGEADIDEDVSPDMADPELGGVTAGENAFHIVSEKGDVNRVSTRSWAMKCGYDPLKLFNKLFHEDILYLLSMDKLWQKRTPPKPLDWNNLPDAVAGTSNQIKAGIKDQQLWSIKDCASVFQQSLSKLKNKLQSLDASDNLVWDKDDDDCMDFVTSCANIRAYCFNIPQKNRFDVKSMAGNIIPAIATTNAIIAGLIVLQLLKVLIGKLEECRTIYLNKQPNQRKKLLVPCILDKPNPKCYVCSEKPEISVSLNIKTTSVKSLEEKILKGQLHMVAPDVEIDDGKGTILISSEEGETEDNKEKVLSDFGIRHGTRLKCDDFLQNFEIVLNILHVDRLDDDKEFELHGEISDIKPKNDSMETNETSVENHFEVDDMDEVVIVENFEYNGKRKASTDIDDSFHSKKPFLEPT